MARAPPPWRSFASGRHEPEAGCRAGPPATLAGGPARPRPEGVRPPCGVCARLPSRLARFSQRCPLGAIRDPSAVSPEMGLWSEAPPASSSRYPRPSQAVEDCGLMLWAAELELSHPIDGRPLRFAQPPPPKYQAFLAREAARWHKFYEAPAPGAPTAEGQPPAL